MMAAQVEMQKTNNSQVIALIVNSDQYAKSVISEVDKLVNKEKLEGIYVTVNKPYASVSSSLESHEVSCKNIFFIDMVSGQGAGIETMSKNCLCLPSQYSLTELSIGIGEAISSMGGGKKFLLFDSVSTLMIYHKPDTVAKFIHFLAGKIREWNVKAVLVMVEGSDADKALLAHISQFVDEVVKA